MCSTRETSRSRSAETSAGNADTAAARLFAARKARNSARSGVVCFPACPCTFWNSASVNCPASAFERSLASVRRIASLKLECGSSREGQSLID